jgi:hypothetical protein
MMRIAADQQIYAAEEPLLFADGSGIRQEPEDGWQAIAVERVQVGTAIPHSTDNRMLLRSLSNEEIFKIWSFGDDWRFDRELTLDDLPDAGQLERDFLVDIDGDGEIGV